MALRATNRSAIEPCPGSGPIIKSALDGLFAQVLGMLRTCPEGLITLERVTLDGTKIKANASGNRFRRKEKLEAHLALAQPTSAGDERNKPQRKTREPID